MFEYGDTYKEEKHQVVIQQLTGRGVIFTFLGHLSCNSECFVL
jgi:hypothetical protein